MDYQLRKDPVISRWVAVQKKSLHPDEYDVLARRKQEGSCPLCIGPQEQALTETASVRGTDGKWILRAVKNPACVMDTDADLGRRGLGMYDMMNSFGVNEIIIESPEHSRPPEELGPEHMAALMGLKRSRMAAIEQDERIRTVLLCKSSGMLAGTVNTHPFSQLLASPVIPLRLKTELDGAKVYFSHKDRCVFCDMLDEEQRTASRVIATTEHFLAFTPFAPKFPFEIWVMPLKHSCAFTEATPEQVNDLGRLMTSLLRKLRAVFKDVSYSYVIHTSPSRIPKRGPWHTLGEDFHWHIEIAPRLLRAEGFEWGSGFYVVATSPEDAARHLREAPDEF